jgi:hypothetical protein
MRTDFGLIVLTPYPGIEKLEQGRSRARSNTVAIVMDLQGKGIVDIFPYPDLQDKRQSISKVS